MERRKACFLFKRQKKGRVAKPTHDFGLMLPYSWSASAAERAILSPLLAKSLGKRPGFFYGAKESSLSLQATEKRTCCEANTGFWFDSPLSVSFRLCVVRNFKAFHCPPTEKLVLFNYFKFGTLAALRIANVVHSIYFLSFNFGSKTFLIPHLLNSLNKGLKLSPFSVSV